VQSGIKIAETMAPVITKKRLADDVYRDWQQHESGKEQAEKKRKLVQQGSLDRAKGIGHWEAGFGQVG
jgi:hypothetical protein